MTACDATVTSVDGDVVTLDRTVAYAFSGGQASDTGTIAGRAIRHAEKDGLEIRYTLAPGEPLAPGDAVRVEIDWPARYRIMRLHFAAELVLEIVNRDFAHPEKVGANITADKARVDFAWEGSIGEALPHIAQRVEQLVAADLPIVSGFEDELSQRRYWEIAGFARVACGGTHLRRTGEVGRVLLRRDNIGRGKERIEIRLVDG